MCVRVFKQNWEEIEKELQEQDVLKLSSLLDLGVNEDELKKRLEACKQKNITLCVHNSNLEADVYMEILELMKQMDEQRKQEILKSQRVGIQKALQRKQEGKGGYGRPRIELPVDFAQKVKECLLDNRPLETYRKQTNMKKSTFYKYVHIVKKEIRYIF